MSTAAEALRANARRREPGHSPVTWARRPARSPSSASS